MVGHSEPFLHPCLATSFAIAFHTTKGIDREHGLVSCICSPGVHTPPARRNNCNFIDIAGIGMDGILLSFKTLQGFECESVEQWAFHVGCM